MSLKSLPECCLTLYLYYSCSTLRKATLIVISGYGVMPSVLKTSLPEKQGSGKAFGITSGHYDDITLITVQDNERVMEF